ncbi:MAG: UDP-N-acetylmuramoyl-L-alanine--D-glutamate ligase, partial [Bacteroidetes bacterium]|nr:UDP-N-acetylmuramoyl-L-alanine--D-glutamate ligase [Bacteroidota bacterium]
MHQETKNIVILGAGESGVGSAILAKKQGFTVFVSDKGEIKEEYRQQLIQREIEFEEGKHTFDRIAKADLLIKSPGIPSNLPWLIEFQNTGKKIVSEIEFAAPYCKAKTICVTGSNGKTTTTLLIHHILKKAGISVGLAGNIGYSFAKQVAEEDFEWYVIELSSFQLDEMFDFKADIALILNITPDHLDRYDYDMQKYVNAKFRITQNQGPSDWLIYNHDDPLITKEIEKRNLTSKTAKFSIKESINVDAYLLDENIHIQIQKPFIMSIHDLALKGKHNAQNSLASGIAARILEIRNDTLRESFSDFVNVEHRMEFVAKVHGIEFINDSKATNVNSSWFALESMDKPTVWIVGGVDKGNDYSELTDLVRDKVKAIICLGENNQKIIDTFGDIVETIVEAKTAMEAVAYGYRIAKKEETVLLSPACASFDLFENYEDRGNQFKQ